MPEKLTESLWYNSKYDVYLSNYSHTVFIQIFSTFGIFCGYRIYIYNLYVLSINSICCGTQSLRYMFIKHSIMTRCWAFGNENSVSF